MKLSSSNIGGIWSFAVAVLLLVIGGMGCSNSTTQTTAPKRSARALTQEEAATRAAELANDECERLYQKRPFKAQQYAAMLEGEVYRWGRLDPGAPYGLSAVVTFRADGSQPEVQVYYSSDTVLPR